MHWEACSRLPAGQAGYGKQPRHSAAPGQVTRTRTKTAGDASTRSRRLSLAQGAALRHDADGHGATEGRRSVAGTLDR